jgi:hypothetical protein
VFTPNVPIFVVKIKEILLKLANFKINLKSFNRIYLILLQKNGVIQVNTRVAVFFTEPVLGVMFYPCEPNVNVLHFLTSE